VAQAKPEKQIGVVQLEGCRCRCGHEWLPREKNDKPRVCPKCKSPNWDRPKRFVRKQSSKKRGGT
jgi:predicted Zn-ribbon and HTH transcriptional regulator